MACTKCESKEKISHVNKNTKTIIRKYRYIPPQPTYEYSRWKHRNTRQIYKIRDSQEHKGQSKFLNCVDHTNYNPHNNNNYYEHKKSQGELYLNTENTQKNPHLPNLASHKQVNVFKEKPWLLSNLPSLMMIHFSCNEKRPPQ